MRWLGRLYAPLLAFSVRRPLVVVAAVVVAMAAGSLGFRGLGRAFLPEFNEGSLTIQMVLPAGTSLATSDNLARQAELSLLADPGVASVGRRTGRPEGDEHVLGVDTSELEVRLRPEDPRPRQAILAAIRARLQPIPAAFTLGQPISHRIEHMVSGQRTAFAVKVYGGDMRKLRATANEVKAALATVPALTDLDIEQATEVPQLVVRADAQAAAGFGRCLQQR